MIFDLDRIYFSPRAMDAIRAVLGPVKIGDVRYLVKQCKFISADAAIRITGGATTWTENVFQVWVDRKLGQRVLEYRVDRHDEGRLMLWDLHDVLHPLTTAPTADYEVTA
jgi:hypothetical protein